MSDTTKKTGSDDIGCLEAIESLYAYLDGELDDPRTIAEVEHHLGHCRSCYSRTEMERALAAQLKKSGGSRAPEELKTRLQNLMDKF